MYQIVCSELSACSLRARPAGVAELRRLCLDGAAALAGETVESWRVESGRGEKRKLVGQDEGSTSLGAPLKRMHPG